MRRKPGKSQDHDNSFQKDPTIEPKDRPLEEAICRKASIAPYGPRGYRAGKKKGEPLLLKTRLNLEE